MRNLLLAISLCALACVPNVWAQPNPGVWVVLDHQRLENTTIDELGSIEVMDGGVLEILRSTINFRPGLVLGPGIHVHSGGRVYLNGTPESPSTLARMPLSPVDPNPPQTTFWYRIAIDHGARLQGTDCRISGPGTNQEYSALDGTQTGFTLNGTLDLQSCRLADFQRYIRGREGTLQLSNVRHEGGGAFASFFGDTIRLSNVTSNGAWLALGAPNLVITNLTMEGDRDCGPWCLVVENSANAAISGLVLKSPFSEGDAYLVLAHSNAMMSDSVLGRGPADTWKLEGANVLGHNLTLRSTVHARKSDLYLQNSTVNSDLEWDAESTLHLRNTALGKTNAHHGSSTGFVWDTTLTVTGLHPSAKALLTHGNSKVEAAANASGTAILHPTRGFLAPKEPGGIDTAERTWTLTTSGGEQSIVIRDRPIQVAATDDGQPTEHAASLTPLALVILALVALAVVRHGSD